jgi:glycosyl transferase family 87
VHLHGYCMSLDDLAPDSAQRDRLWRSFLLLGACLMAAAALYRIPVELSRLATEPLGSGAATDLIKRFREVHPWFDGRPVYGVIESADYPPASYILLYPLVHWPSFEITRLVWMATTVAALLWLSVIMLRETRASTPIEQAFVVLLPLASYAAAANIRIGQMGIHLIPLLLAGLLVLARQARSWKRDVLAAVLLVAALVKPTFSVPFFWVAFFRGGFRFTALAVGSYVALTLWGAAYQQDSLVALIQGWLGQSGNVEAITAHANLFSWLAAAGLQDWYLPASLLVLVAAGVWTWWYRERDVWVLIAVASLVARFWSYHRWYDDILVLPAMIALYRMIATEEQEGRRDLIAMGFFVMLWGFSVSPAHLMEMPDPWGSLFKGTKTITWVLLLIELLRRTHRRTIAAEHERQLEAA